MAIHLDPKLKDFCTARQCEYIDAINKHRTYRKAATALDITHPTLARFAKKIVVTAALRGYSPDHDMSHTVPEPFVVRGVSTYYGKDGKPTGQWVKSKLDDNKFKQFVEAALEGMQEEIPRLPPIAVTLPISNDNLLNCYVITDYHMGMLSWHEETGEDWDIKIAENLIIKWFTQAIAQSPPAKQCVFAQLSDFLHFDGLEPLTPASKHLLDVDTRFAKLVRTAIRVIRQIIDALLHKYEQVHVIMADANHDPVSQIWLREWFSVLYENEPRLTVDTSPSPYNVFEFGQVALFFHHGHKRKVTNVSEVFAGKFREVFGRTKHAYAHMGHMHHADIKENPLMIVEQHRTLAPQDAYAARGGWLSGRDAQVITYHREFGHVSRIVINSDMLR